MRICFLPQDFNASGMYRLVFPYRELEKQGHWAKTPYYHKIEQTESGFEFLDFDINHWPQADLYVFQSPLDIGALRVIKTMRRHGHLCVAEADDTTLHLPEWHPAWAGTHPSRNPLRNRDIRHAVYRACDAMTVSTPALAEDYAPFNPTIRVLPNYLLGEMWANVPPQYTVERERLRVGWMGRSHWRHGDLAILKPWLGDWLRQHPNIDFVAAGDESVHDQLGIPQAQRVSYPPIKFPKGLAEITATMDIGLVPLAAERFNECKSALKGMEYAACGIPCVASHTQQYEQWCADGNGLLADTPSDWVAALERLATDRRFRRRMGEAAENKALQHTIDKHAHKWADFYQWLIDRKQRQTYGPTLRTRQQPGSPARPPGFVTQPTTMSPFEKPSLPAR